MVGTLGLAGGVGYSVHQNRFVLFWSSFTSIRETELCNSQTSKYTITNCDYCYEEKGKGMLRDYKEATVRKVFSEELTETWRLGLCKPAEE